GQELLRLDPRGVDRVDVGEDDLERALEDLGLAADLQIVPRLERSRQVLRRVPEPGADAAGLVPQLELQIEIPLAIGPELLVGATQDLVDRLPVCQRVDVVSAHASSGHSGSGSGRGRDARAGPPPVEGSIVGTGRQQGQGGRRTAARRAGTTSMMWRPEG